jgi:hypothetical protein
VSPWNAKIARVDQPEPGLLSLSFRAEGRNEVLILVTLPGMLQLGVVDERPRGASASPAVSQLRRHVEGARIETVEMSHRAARLSLTRAHETRFLIAAPSKPYGAWWLCDTEGPVVVRSPGAPQTVPTEDEHLYPKSLDELRACGTSALGAHRRTRSGAMRSSAIWNAPRQQKSSTKKRASYLRMQRKFQLIHPFSRRRLGAISPG